MMKLKMRTPAAFVGALTLGLALPAGAQHAAHAPQLGEVDFAVDCNAQAQTAFNTAMAYYHSFAWSHIGEPIDRVLQADPNCGMAHWLRSLAMLDNPFT